MCFLNSSCAAPSSRDVRRERVTSVCAEPAETREGAPSHKSSGERVRVYLYTRRVKFVYRHYGCMHPFHPTGALIHTSHSSSHLSIAQPQPSPGRWRWVELPLPRAAKLGELLARVALGQRAQVMASAGCCFPARIVRAWPCLVERGRFAVLCLSNKDPNLRK